MLKEFKSFAMRGNVLDMAVGIIIGAAFGTIVSSLVNDIIMPPIGIVLGNIDFKNLFLVIKQGTSAIIPFLTIDDAQKAGAVTLNYGRFVNTIITFLIVAFAVFLLVKGMNTAKKNDVEAAAVFDVKICPHCATEIPIKAAKCPHCTSDLQ
jgi:large conductance mechanosensitive channel